MKKKTFNLIHYQIWRSNENFSSINFISIVPIAVSAGFCAGMGNLEEPAEH